MGVRGQSELTVTGYGRSAAEAWSILVKRTRELIRQGRGDVPLPDPAALIDEMREERDAQILAGLL